MTGEVRAAPLIVIEITPARARLRPGIGISQHRADLVIDIGEPDAETVGNAAWPADDRHQPAEGMADLGSVAGPDGPGAIGNAAPAIERGDQIGVIPVTRRTGEGGFDIGPDPVQQHQRLGPVGRLAGGVVGADRADDDHRRKAEPEQNPEQAEPRRKRRAR